MAMTVTATMSGAAANEHIYLWIRVLTGATEAGGNSATGIAGSGGSTISVSLTPNGSSSLPCFAVTGDNDTTTYTALANNTVDSFSGDPDTWGAAFGRYTGTVTAATPVTFGVNCPGGGADYTTWACYEVLSSGGSTPSVDASSPALASATGAGIKTVTSASFTPPAGSVVVAMICCGGTGSSGSMVMTVTDTGGGLTWTKRAGSATVTDQDSFVFTATVAGGGGGAAPVPVQARPGKTWRRRFDSRRLRLPMPFQASPVTVNAGLATAAGAALNPVLNPYIAGLGGTGAGYFADQGGKPRMWLGDEIWALITNAGRWNSGNYQATFDAYFATRAAQGYTVCYSDMFNSTFIGGATNGQMWNGQTPFTGGNPSSGLNSTYWQVIDYALNSALANGITIALSFGGHWDWDTSGNAMNGFTGTQYSDAGNAIGTRYKSQANLIWLIMDDYFGSFDSSLTSLLTGLRASGDTHPIAIENYAETSSRFDLSTNSSLTWGAANTQYNFGYSYSCSYLCIEYMYAESSPLTPIYGDGYFYQGGSTYQGGSGAGALDRAIRQDAWWAVTSGARGFNVGDEALWQWPSGAPAAVSTQWYAANNAGIIRTVMESLTGWHTLVPDTASALVTAGRGTRGTQFSSGGGGGQYEPATTNSFVSAARTPDSGSGSSLAVMYLPNSTTITIDQTKIAAGYTATWVDPVSGATSSATTGSTYNSTAKGNNSQGDPDWVLVLQAPTSVSAAAGLATGTGTAQGAAAAIGVNAAAATGTGAAQGPAITTATSVTAGLATGTGTAQGPVAAIGVSAALATGAAAAQNATASTSASGTGNAVLATGTGAAQNPVPAIGVNAVLATGTGAAQNATASTSSSGSATAVLATGAGAAQSPVPAIGVNAALATGTGTAQQPSPATAASVTAVLATGTGAALNATVQTSGSATAPAVLATGTGTAQNPVPAIAVNAAAATGTGTALNAGRAASAGLASGTAAAQNPATVLAAQARAQAAQALAAALNATGAAVEPFTTGRLTTSDAPLAALTASDTRTGGPG